MLAMKIAIAAKIDLSIHRNYTSKTALTFSWVGTMEKPRAREWRGLSLQRSADASCEVQRAIIDCGFLIGRTFVFGAGSSLCAWAFLASRRAVKRAAFS